MTALAIDFGDEDFSATMTAVAEEFEDMDFPATMTAIAEEFDNGDFSATMTAISVDLEDLFNPATMTAIAVEMEGLEDLFNPATMTAIVKELEDLGIEVPDIEVPDLLASPVPLLTPESTVLEPERMSLEEFKGLYSNPSTRPIVLDVRSPNSFQEKHIAGAQSFPLSEADSRVGELSKDKLIVAYCQ
jgi:hypothetical protein